MAYRYFDGQGNEVALVDRRALALRIRFGHITPKTLILDEDRKAWVRAELHPTYTELVEGASGDGNRPTELAVGAPSANSISFEPFDADMAKAVRGDVVQPREVESSASPESVRATRTPSADPTLVSARSARFALAGQDLPRIRKVAPRRTTRRLATRSLIVGIVAPVLVLLAVLLLLGGAGWASTLSTALRGSDPTHVEAAPASDLAIRPSARERLQSSVEELRRGIWPAR
ncbi:MAG: hypothetical protein V3T24_12735 [Longimicrobiales bacterium]